MKLKSRPFRFQLTKFRKKLESTIIFDKKIAQSYHDIRYYKAIQSDVKNLPKREAIMKKFRTRRKALVTKFLEDYKKLVDSKSQSIFHRLTGIYKKNKEAAFKNLPVPTHSNLIYIVSSIPMLVVVYKKIRGNKGANTLAYIMSDDKYNNLEPALKSYMNKIFQLPDGISKKVFQETSRLLRTGKYPWGRVEESMYQSLVNLEL